jgi:hypothetical protein
MTFSLDEAVRHPKIYAYTTPIYKKTKWVGSREGVGLLKIGFTDRNVNTRINEQLNAIKQPQKSEYEIVLAESAIDIDGCLFLDHEVHRALKRAGVNQLEGEFFECTKAEALAAIESVKQKSHLSSLSEKKKFPMRPEQIKAVELTSSYFEKNKNAKNPPHFLWNAKMRFGKTFTTYQLAKKLKFRRILVLTYKPAVETAWRDDLLNHHDFDGWIFKGKEDPAPNLKSESPIVWFASFQDALGVDEKGNPKAKNEGLHLTDWDLVVIDEYHFGAWRDAARSLYIADKDEDLTGDSSEKNVLDTPDLDDDFRKNLEDSVALKVRNYLYLSGTPFRALTEGEFLEDQVYNWTYSDEQREKANWTSASDNPYLSLPKMHLLTYEMPEKLKLVALNNSSEFSLTEFFRTEKSEQKVPIFKHHHEVQKWLDVLRGQDLDDLWQNITNTAKPPLPYEDSNLLKALQHTVWYLPSVDACTAMANMLKSKENIFFRDYEIIVAAGAKAGLGEKALPPVQKAITNVPQDSKTITLSCGKLMTGVTVPAWTGILMLRELKSPETYFQAAFRVQSPWLTKGVDVENGGEVEIINKDSCYVLDFSPNRALRLIVDYATRLRTEVASEKDNEKAISEFMEFLPVLSFDGYTMNHLSAADVINFLTRGVSASMLARRWNSPELITLNINAVEALLENKNLLASLEEIEVFREINKELNALISANEELKNKKLTKEPLTEREQKIKDEATKHRENLKEKLRRFVARIPVFMYLTDDREKSVKEIILQSETDLFTKVTGLSLNDFKQLVDAGVFNDSKMDDAVWKFRNFEEPSLRYLKDESAGKGKVGGWA